MAPAFQVDRLSKNTSAQAPRPGSTSEGFLHNPRGGLEWRRCLSQH